MDKALQAYRDSVRVDYAIARALRSRLWSATNALNTVRRKPAQIAGDLATLDTGEVQTAPGKTEAP
jgi:hypothetical protein